VVDDVRVLPLLAVHGVLPPELGEQMRRAVGFRNVLVHEYVDVDNAVVLKRLRQPDDLEHFAAAVARYLQQHRLTR